MKYTKEEHIRNFEAWSGGKDTLNHIIELGLEDRLEQYFNDIFGDKEEPPTDTEINDILWFETSSIYEYLDLTEDGEVKTDWHELNNDTENEDLIKQIYDIIKNIDEKMTDEALTKLAEDNGLEVTDKTPQDLPQEKVFSKDLDGWGLEFTLRKHNGDTAWAYDNWFMVDYTSYYTPEVIEGYEKEHRHELIGE